MSNEEPSRNDRQRSNDEGFRKSLKYHDRESYENQIHHNVGIGIFCTDDIDDLPPRHRTKVKKAWEVVQRAASITFPPNIDTFEVINAVLLATDVLPSQNRNDSRVKRGNSPPSFTSSSPLKRNNSYESLVSSPSVKTSSGSSHGSRNVAETGLPTSHCSNNLCRNSYDSQKGGVSGSPPLPVAFNQSSCNSKRCETYSPPRPTIPRGRGSSRNVIKSQVFVSNHGNELNPINNCDLKQNQDVSILQNSISLESQRVPKKSKNKNRSDSESPPKAFNSSDVASNSPINLQSDISKQKTSENNFSSQSVFTSKDLPLRTHSRSEHGSDHSKCDRSLHKNNSRKSNASTSRNSKPEVVSCSGISSKSSTPEKSISVHPLQSIDPQRKEFSHKPSYTDSKHHQRSISKTSGPDNAANYSNQNYDSHTYCSSPTSDAPASRTVKHFEKSNKNSNTKKTNSVSKHDRIHSNTSDRMDEPYSKSLYGPSSSNISAEYLTQHRDLKNTQHPNKANQHLKHKHFKSPEGQNSNVNDANTRSEIFTRTTSEQFSNGRYPQSNRSIRLKSHVGVNGYVPNLTSNEMENEVYDIDENTCEELGFYVHINVSEKWEDREHWESFLRNIIGDSGQFELQSCCSFTEFLILSFNNKDSAKNAHGILSRHKRNYRNVRYPHITHVESIRTRIFKPCGCERKIFQSTISEFNEICRRFSQEHIEKINDINDQIKILRSNKDMSSKQQRATLENSREFLEDLLSVFENRVNEIKNSLDMLRYDPTTKYAKYQKQKNNFSHECNSFKRCLPIYTKKNEIMRFVSCHPVSIIIAETGSGKTTQVPEYLLHTQLADLGKIICTQPRKMAAISISQFVSSQIGSPIGQKVGYDVGIEKKVNELDTKLIYMTDYALLRFYLRNKSLKGISCVIIDEAHERTLYTDLLLGILKRHLDKNPATLSIVITSATINPEVFIEFFKLREDAVIKVPGRTYPVKVHWLDYDVDVSWNYLEACVDRAYKIHQKEPPGDILVFLTSPGEIEDAIHMYRAKSNSDSDMPLLCSLHGKSELKEQMQIFDSLNNEHRKIIFATNSAETSLTIPGVKYVIDSGMAKEMIYYPTKNKNCLILNFINKSSAEQRKGRAGRTQPGICYRMYSKENYNKMAERSLPEILRSNLQKALLKIYEFGLQPQNFEFVEMPSKEAIEKSLRSLKVLELVSNEKLTDLGRQVSRLSIEPRLAKLVLMGSNKNICHEVAIIAAMLNEAGRLFLRFDDIKDAADEKKKELCHVKGDLWTYLRVYKQWLALPREQRYKWCCDNYLHSKALKSAHKTVSEIFFNLQELNLPFSKEFNEVGFEAEFLSILTECFSENLCVFSGHPKLGYFSGSFRESLSIHPSSSICYLSQGYPSLLIYSVLLETARTYIAEITPVSEDLVRTICHRGKLSIPLDALLHMQLLPKFLGPFGKTVLSNYILGHKGFRMANLEDEIAREIRTRNFRLDIKFESGLITVFVEKRYHEKIAHFIQKTVADAHLALSVDEYVQKMEGGFSYFCIGLGGLVNEIIMPGEFRELIIDNFDSLKIKSLEKDVLPKYGAVQAFNCTNLKSNAKKRICVTFKKVASAKKALWELSKQDSLNVKSKINVPANNEKSLPFYRLDVSLCRLPCIGTGWIAFKSESDCIYASGTLSRKPLSIENHSIRFIPSSISKAQLEMKNLPPMIEEKELWKLISTALSGFSNIQDIYIRRKQGTHSSQNDINDLKSRLQQLFSPFVPSSKLEIDVVKPERTDSSWKAKVYFEQPADGEKCFKELNGKTVDKVPVSMIPVLESSLTCPVSLYNIIKSNLDSLNRRFKDVTFSERHVKIDDSMIICFSCSTMSELVEVKSKLVRLIKGRMVNFLGNFKYYPLFHPKASKMVQSIQKNSNTLIMLDTLRKIASIHGTAENCNRAEQSIHEHFKDVKVNKTRTFNVKDPGIPLGFLRQIFKEFGLHLEGLVCEFNLQIANIDHETGKLVLGGSKESLEKAENYLEGLCSKLFNEEQSQRKDKDPEICAICLDPVMYDFHRLERCGHAFCKDCILLQVQSRTLPLVCAKQNCSKEFFVTDIRQILRNSGKDAEKSFYSASLHKFVTNNVESIRYCPIPNCHMIYRVSAIGSELRCYNCDNVICTRCNSLYHFGLSCDMYINTLKDEDYSLKVWLKENKSRVKNCPKCKVLIEKDEGCNHMTCANCQSHICWLCLQIFENSDLVYLHLPYCSENQGPD